MQSSEHRVHSPPSRLVWGLGGQGGQGDCQHRLGPGHGDRAGGRRDICTKRLSVALARTRYTAGERCHIDDMFLGFLVHADDLVILKNMLAISSMLFICVQWSVQFGVKFPTDKDVLKSNTKVMSDLPFVQTPRQNCPDQLLHGVTSRSRRPTILTRDTCVNWFLRFIHVISFDLINSTVDLHYEDVRRQRSSATRSMSQWRTPLSCPGRLTIRSMNGPTEH